MSVFTRLLDVNMLIPDFCQILDPASFVDYWEAYTAEVLTNLDDRTPFDLSRPMAFALSGDVNKSHILSATVTFDSFALPLAATAVFTPLRTATAFTKLADISGRIGHSGSFTSLFSSGSI